MTNQKIQKTLEDHSVAYRLADDRILAEEVMAMDGHSWSYWMDVTGWTAGELAIWLGY